MYYLEITDKNIHKFHEELNVQNIGVKSKVFHIDDSNKDNFVQTEINVNLIRKTLYINEMCKKDIEAGFISNALGTAHKYESEEIDQLNLIGAVSSGIEQPFKCSSDDGKIWEYKVHTAEQLKQVISDGAIVKANYLQKATELKEQAKTANSIEDLELITWK